MFLSPGGKDSTVLLDMVRRIYPEVPAVFIDTGLEYPELRDFVKTIDNVIWLKPEMNFRRVIETYGYPIISKRIAGYVSSAKNNPNCVRAKYLKGEIDNTMFGGNGKWSFLIDAPFKVSDYCCNKMKKEPNKHFAKRLAYVPFSEQWLLKVRIENNIGYAMDVMFFIIKNQNLSLFLSGQNKIF